MRISRDSWKATLAYSSVGMPLSTLSLPMAIFLAPFYAGEMGLPLASLATAMLIARLLDFGIDPMIGYVSDRSRSRWGRRKPFIVVGSILLIAGSQFLLKPHPGVGLLYFIGWLNVLYLGFSLVGVAHKAWGSELAIGYDERTKLYSVRQGFTTAGFVLATVVPAIVLGQPGAKSANVLSALSYILLIGLPLTVGLCLWFTPDRAAAAAPSARGEATGLSLRKNLRTFLRNGPLCVILGVLLIGFTGETFRQTMTVFFARDVVGVKNLGLVYVYFFIVAFAGVPVWRLVAKRFGKHVALASGVGVSICSNLCLSLLGRGDELAFTLLFALKGFCFGALELIPAAMLADAADVDTAMTRRERAGLLFALSGILTNVGQALGQFGSLQSLAFIGYTAAGEHDPERLRQLSLLYAFVPAGIMAFGLWLATRYTLTAQRHSRIRQRVDRRKGQGGASQPA